MTATTYGMHLTLRIANIERVQALEGSRQITDILVTLVQRIGMRILAGPVVGQEEGPADKSGWSGVVILYESHTAIHTYPERREAFLDVFSCVDFEVETVIHTLIDLLGDFSVVEQNLFQRGIHWSADAKAEMDAWVQTR